MWILTTTGFYSVVQKPGQRDLTVRACVAADLDRLRDRYLPTLSPTSPHAGTDYPFRATASHADLAEALARIARDLDYANFKDEVARTLGRRRAGVYHDVWAALQTLEHQD